MQAQRRSSQGAEDEDSGSRSLTSPLQATDIFGDLTEKELEDVHSVIRMQQCSAGTLFYRPGDREERLFVLKEDDGLVELGRKRVRLLDVNTLKREQR